MECVAVVGREAVYRQLSRLECDKRWVGLSGWLFSPTPVAIIMPRCACAEKAYGSLLVFLSVCHSVCYWDSGSTCAIQVLKHAQMGTKPCFLGLKLASYRFLR